MNDGKRIYKSWRENGEKKFEMVEVKPYFYVKEDEKEPSKYKASKYIDRDFEYIRGDWVNIDNEPLKKVVVDTSFDIKKAKDMFKKTYEADVPFHFRYAVDEINEMPEYKMRKWYWDMEWQQGGEHHDEITTIVVYDNYDKQYYQWVWFPEEQFIEQKVNQSFHHFVFDNEKDMLENFMTTMVVKDPDMLIAWFGHFADIPKLSLIHI